MAGHDPKDTTSVDRAVPDYEAAIGKSVKGMKIGIPREYRLDGMPAEIEKLWSEGAAWLKAAGAELAGVDVVDELPRTEWFVTLANSPAAARLDGASVRRPGGEEHRAPHRARRRRPSCTRAPCRVLARYRDRFGAGRVVCRAPI